MKSTKKALLLSALSVLLCVTLLMGTTLAWFTDSAQSGVNKIVAGNLDVELEYSKDAANWETVEGATDLFDNVALWEPGSISVVYLKIKNAGTLAIKYNFAVVAEGGDFVNVDNETVNLKNALKVAKIESATAPAELDEETAIDTVSALALGFTDFSKVGTMAPGEEAYVTLIVSMPKTIDNTYNRKKGTPAPEINVGVSLVATQTALGSPWVGGYDDDGLLSNTDDSAKTVKIYSAEQLASFAKSVNNGTGYAGYTVTLETDIDLCNFAWTPIGIEPLNTAKSFHGIFDGQGYTVMNLNVTDDNAAGLFGTAYGTIKNVNVDTATVTSNHYAGAICAYNDGSNVKILNCSVKDATITTNTIFTGDDYDNGDKAGGIVGYTATANVVDGCTVENVTVKGYRDIGGIVGCANTGATVTNNTANNVTLINDRTHNYQDYTTDAAFNVNGTIGRVAGGAILNNNTATNVTKQVIVANTADAQVALDAAQNGETIILAAGTYDKLYLRQDLAVSTRVTEWDRDSSYPAFYREMKDITIVADGAVVSKGIVAEAGLFWHSSAPASNQAAMNKATGGFVSYLALENITIDGITFDSSENCAIVLRDNFASADMSPILVDGLTIQNCVGTGVADNSNIHFFSAGSGTNDQCFPGTTKKALNNIVIKDNTFNSYYQPICMNNNSAVLTNLTVDGNTFNNCVDNQIQLSNKVNDGNITITNNVVNGMSGRLIRMTSAQTTTTVTFTNNAINNPVKYDSGNDGTIAKVTGLVGFTVVDSGNGWTAGANGVTTSATWSVLGDVSKLPTP